jgi:hypothetical protein
MDFWLEIERYKIIPPEGVIIETTQFSDSYLHSFNKQPDRIYCIQYIQKTYLQEHRPFHHLVTTTTLKHLQKWLTIDPKEIKECPKNDILQRIQSHLEPPLTEIYSQFIRSDEYQSYSES